jgi:hypothetical protein
MRGRPRLARPDAPVLAGGRHRKAGERKLQSPVPACDAVSDGASCNMALVAHHHGTPPCLYRHEAQGVSIGMSPIGSMGQAIVTAQPSSVLSQQRCVMEDSAMEDSPTRVPQSEGALVPRGSLVRSSVLPPRVCNRQTNTSSYCRPWQLQQAV